MIDFHSHVLPGIDDGAADEKMAAAMLSMSFKQGVDAVVVTPHYYHHGKNPEEFISRRDELLKQLVMYLEKEEIQYPGLIKGAEVKFSHELLKSDDLEKFFIEGTNAILLEMPFNCWNSWMFDLLFEVGAKKNIEFIIAHAERYVNGLKNFEKLRPLLDMNFMIQVNAESVYSFGKRAIVKKLFAENKVHIIGSDMHNTASRRPTIDKAFKFIMRKYGKDACEKIFVNEKNLLK